MIYSLEAFKEYKQSNFHIIEDPQELLGLVKPFDLDGKPCIILDTETHPYYENSHAVPSSVVRRWVGTGKNAVPQDYPFEISVCDGTNCYALFDSIDNGFKKFRALAPLLEDPEIEKVFHNAKFDMHMLHNAGMKLVGKLHDTVIASKLANENRDSFQLIDLATKVNGSILTFEHMVDSYKSNHKISDYRHIPMELLAEYANADVWNTYLVLMDNYPVLKDEGLMDLYNNELELMIVLYAMERHGMRVDADYEAPLKQELQEVVDTSERAVYNESGTVFNMNSTKQLYQVLLDMGVDPSWIKMTEKGNPSLDAKALDTLAEKHGVSIVQKILEYRRNLKLLNTYAIGIYSQRDSEYKVHSNINQTEATTGRMSITKPALQTLPKNDKRIRGCFIPTNEDYEYWMLDLSQMEYRLFAHYAKAEELLKAIDEGYDVHKATAAIIFNKPYEEVTEEERQKAKTTNFSLVYGQGDKHTSEMLKMSMTETVNFKANYFSQIPEAKPFIASVHEVIKARGFIKNFYGRRRRLTRDEAYKAPNALIQGCAADYMKHKLVDTYKYLQHHNMKTRILNVVHDEEILEVHKSEVDQMPVLRWLFSDFQNFRCSIIADASRGIPSYGIKEEVPDIGFRAPESPEYLQYNVFNGRIFDD